MANKNPEQKARDQIDALLEQAGWAMQDKSKIDFSAAIGAPCASTNQCRPRRLRAVCR